MTTVELKTETKGFDALVNNYSGRGEWWGIFVDP